tara:strand:+ start:8011 stop:8946 length:936 start_codon:yes stop_codon:yes gene_type:complete
MIDKLFNVELKLFKSNLDFFINLYLESKLPQTLLFTGDKSIGKLDFTYHLVNFILSQQEETKYNVKSYKINIESKTFKQLSKNSHPNFFLISSNESRKNIEISQIKNLQNFLNKSCFNNLPKIIVINESEYLNLSSSNALLKLLEKNYSNVFFILIHDIKKTLIPTIKSRCITFKFYLSDSDKIQRINEILDNQYDTLSSDFKNKYLSPIFFSDLRDYCKKNSLELSQINLNNLLFDIFLKKNFKKSTFVYNNFFLLIQLFLFRRIEDKLEIEKYFSLLKYFTKRFDDVIKYNLDFESYVLEFKYLIYDEK